MTLSDPKRPKLPKFVHFAPFLIFVMGLVRNFKFGLCINGSKSQLDDDKSSPKGPLSWSRDTF